MTDNLECPVCHEVFQDPKILPCTHLVCGKCVLSWLQEEGGEGGCPLCRAPVLSLTPLGHDDIAAQVNALPTDLVTVALVQSEKILQGHPVCGVCDDDDPATSYCLQCDVKLCKSCSKTHKKYPAFRDHTLENLSLLTAQRLAANRRSPCSCHSDRLVELYCPAHQKLLCLLCATTDHRGCSEVKKIADMATAKRTELTDRAERLRDKESSLSQQIDQIKEDFKVMWKKAQDIFDDLLRALQKRRDEVNAQIKRAEDAAMTSLALTEKQRAALKSNRVSIEQLALTSSGEALLEMTENLTSRLDDLESQTSKLPKVTSAVDVNFDPQTLTDLKTAIGNFGQARREREAVSTRQGSYLTAAGQTTQRASRTRQKSTSKPGARSASTSRLTTPKTLSLPAPKPTTSAKAATPTVKSKSPTTPDMPKTAVKATTTSAALTSTVRTTTRGKESSSEARSTIGRSVTSAKPAATRKPAVKFTGPELALVLMAGHRVKRGAGWESGDVDGSVPGPGTVLEIGEEENEGWVWVSWDAGSDIWHKMGETDTDELVYELELF